MGPKLRAALGALALTALGCASAPPPPPPPPPGPVFVDGVRQTPLTPEEAGELVQGAGRDIRLCYLRERMNSPRQSEYVVQMRIPSNGRPADTEIIEDTLPDQQLLEDCVVSVLRKVKFPAHVGKMITINVPVRFEP